MFGEETDTFLKQVAIDQAKEESDRVAALETVKENTKNLLLAAGSALGEICAAKTSEDCLEATRTFNARLEEAREAVYPAITHMPA